jgi:hypothetical protein
VGRADGVFETARGGSGCADGGGGAGGDAWDGSGDSGASGEVGAIVSYFLN